MFSPFRLRCFVVILSQFYIKKNVISTIILLTKMYCSVIHSLAQFSWHVFIITVMSLFNKHDGISNHQPHDCLLNPLFKHRSKKTSKLCVTGLCVGNSPVTGEFPTQMASNTENVSIWWRHHVWILMRTSRSCPPLHWAVVITITLDLTMDTFPCSLLDPQFIAQTTWCSLCNELQI